MEPSWLGKGEVEEEGRWKRRRKMGCRGGRVEAVAVEEAGRW
jgi:hypothetical protein